MTITAKIICDSINPEGVRLSTLQLRYPRFIHAEFMTHRVFSRNASSSRAIPVERLIEDIERDPVFPSFWGKNQKGMQAREELEEFGKYKAAHAWETAMKYAIHTARRLVEIGAHKQVVNRILEPFSHINVLVSSTDWKNFDFLRRHPDAQPEIKELADTMYEARAVNRPIELRDGQWHVPYVAGHEQVHQRVGIFLSVARCARVSYLTHDGVVPTVDSDLALYDALLKSSPVHASPAEHQATPINIGTQEKVPAEIRGNFRGWLQHRKLLEGECVHG